MRLLSKYHRLCTPPTGESQGCNDAPRLAKPIGHTGRYLRAFLCLLLIGWAGAGCSGFAASDTPDAPARFEHMVGTAPGETSTTTTSGTLWYQLELAPHHLKVRIRLLQPPAHTTFFLPAQWAGHDDYARAIHINAARVPGGDAPYSVERNSGRIEVESNRADWVQLEYSVDLSNRSDRFGRFHPRFADQIFFAYGPAFLVLPSAQIIDSIRDIPIEIHAPSNWKILSTWSARKTAASKTTANTTIYGYLAQSPAALRDAFVVGGQKLIVDRRDSSAQASPTVLTSTKTPNKRAKDDTRATRPSTTNHSPVTLGFDRGTRIDRNALSQKTTQILGTYRRRFGDLGPVSAYIRHVATLGGQEHLGVGRHGGFVIEIRQSTRADTKPAGRALDPQILLLLAHEAFHMWNGHTLTPAPETEPKTRWFKEGFTHYMALKTLAELGLFEREDVLAELDKSGSHYLRNPAARSDSRRRTTAVDRARIPYDRGVLLALSIDTFLSDHSNGHLGVHDWFRALMSNLAERHQPYRAGHLRAAFIGVAEQSGMDATEAARFWQAQVDTSTPLDPKAIFKRAGLHWLNAAQQKRRRLLRLKLPNSPFERLFPPLKTAQPSEHHGP